MFYLNSITLNKCFVFLTVNSKTFNYHSIFVKLLQLDVSTYCHKPCDLFIDIEAKLRLLKQDLRIDKHTTSCKLVQINLIQITSYQRS